MKKFIIIVTILISSILNAYELDEIEAMLTTTKLTELPDVAKNLSAVGSIHHSKKDYNKAILYYNQSLSIREHLGLNKSYSFANILFLLSIAEDKSGRSCNALISSKKAIDIYYYLGRDEDVKLIENEIQNYSNSCISSKSKLAFSNN
jgi:hypothetical protein